MTEEVGGGDRKAEGEANEDEEVEENGDRYCAVVVDSNL